MTLITGATGFVGAHVAELLCEKIKNVRALVRRTSNTRLIQHLPLEFIVGDLRHRESLRRALKDVTRVFHVAADYRLWSQNPAELYESNVEGTRKLIEASRESGIERFVYTSTVGTIAIPGMHTLPDENTMATHADMIGHYKKSKLIAEEQVLNAVAHGFPAVIVNPTTPVGPGDWKPTPTGRIIVDFLNGRMPAYVDTGMNVVAVEDVAEGHWLAYEKGRVGQRYILGARNMTLKEILDVLGGIAHQRSPRVRIPHIVPLIAGYAENFVSALLRREPRIPLEGVRMARHKMFVEPSLATREIGFHQSSVEAALERAVRWYIDNGYVHRKATLEAHRVMQPREDNR